MSSNTYLVLTLICALGVAVFTCLGKLAETREKSLKDQDSAKERGAAAASLRAEQQKVNEVTDEINRLVKSIAAQRGDQKAQADLIELQRLRASARPTATGNAIDQIIAEAPILQEEHRQSIKTAAQKAAEKERQFRILWEATIRAAVDRFDLRIKELKARGFEAELRVHEFHVARSPSLMLAGSVRVREAVIAGKLVSFTFSPFDAENGRAVLSFSANTETSGTTTSIEFTADSARWSEGGKAQSVPSSPDGAVPNEVILEVDRGVLQVIRVLLAAASSK